MAGQAIDQPAPKDRAAGRGERAIAHWLLAVCALVFLMVVLGGVTRLTQSGLSIVEWQPIMGVLPPLSEGAWQEAFEKYQQFPEYQKINRGMSLGEFKEIFWFEYFHRLLGRLIGAAFILPFLYFLIRGRIRRALAPHLVVMFVLGGLQGLLGWYMVKSGLVDRPDVSPYRLTAHLALAVAVYAYMLWTAMGLLSARGRVLAQSAGHGIARVFAPVIAGLVFLTMLSGGFVAGNDAGFAYNTFPLMDDRIVPRDIFLVEPLWRNFFETVPLVQLDHRLLAMLTVACVVALWALSLRSRLPGVAHRALNTWFAMALIQFGLGISTLLLYVPVALGAAHQAGAMLALTFALWSCHELYRKA